jgi:hypothetical protein
MYSQVPEIRYKEAIIKGLDYLLAAQYPMVDGHNFTPGPKVITPI